MILSVRGQTAYIVQAKRVGYVALGVGQTAAIAITM